MKCARKYSETSSKLFGLSPYDEMLHESTTTRRRTEEAIAKTEQARTRARTSGVGASAVRVGAAEQDREDTQTNNGGWERIDRSRGRGSDAMQTRLSTATQCTRCDDVLFADLDPGLEFLS